MATKPGSLKPVHQKLELDLDEGATRVHKFPKELIHRLREKEAAKSVPPPAPDDRTAVFRAPPELLARAMRAKLSGQVAEEQATQQNDLPTKPPPAGADEEIADSGVKYSSESTSGISLRRSGLGEFSPMPPSRASLGSVPPPRALDGSAEIGAEQHAEDGWSLPEPAAEDPTLIRSEGSTQKVFDALALAPPTIDDSPPISLVDSDPVTEALLNTDVDALLAPAAPPPSYRVLAAAPASTPPAVADEASLSVPSASPEPRASRSRYVVLGIVVVAIALAICLRLGVTLH